MMDLSDRCQDCHTDGVFGGAGLFRDAPQHTKSRPAVDLPNSPLPSSAHHRRSILVSGQDRRLQWIPFSSAPWFAFRAVSQTSASSPASASLIWSSALSTPSTYCGTVCPCPTHWMLLGCSVAVCENTPFYNHVLFACLVPLFLLAFVSWLWYLALSLA